MRTQLAIGLAVVALLAGRAAPANAQDSVLAELYGFGVHSYFAGQYEDAHEYLTTAVEQGTRDPRVYYFRGLTYTRLGRPDEAKADYMKGADLESSGADRVYPIGRSLQRVQGRSRIEVERHRQKARLVARTRNMKANAARYEQLQNAEGQVLRDANRPPPAAAQDLVGQPADDAANDPFADDAPEETPQPAPQRPAPDAGGDLFGDAPAEPAAPTTPEPAPAAGEDDPFGDAPAPAEDDPFGDPGDSSDDAMDDPFGDAPADDGMSADDDPFS